MDGTQGIFIFLGIFWELKPTFALSKEKIRFLLANNADELSDKDIIVLTYLLDH